MAIVKRGSKFGVRIWDPREKRHTWIGTYATRDDALLAEIQAKRDPARTRTETVAQFAERWQRDYNYDTRSGEPRWGAKTLRDNRYALRSLVERFGSVRLSAFPVAEARPWAQRQPERYVAVARVMFADAVRDGLAPSNPFANLRLSRSRGRRGILVLSEAELEHLIDTAERVHGPYGATFAAVVATAGYVGCRPGELFALEPRDVDAANNEVFIRQSHNSVELKAPKNNEARRVILPPGAVRRIERMPRSISSRWLFTTPRGGRLNKGSLNYHWRVTRERFEAELDPERAAELQASRAGKPFQFYELRHTAATILLERGASIDLVAFQLGHRDGGRLVATLYGHPDQARMRRELKAAFGTNVKPLQVAEQEAISGGS